MNRRKMVKVKKESMIPKKRNLIWFGCRTWLQKCT